MYDSDDDNSIEAETPDDEDLTNLYNTSHYSLKYGEYREALESADTYLKHDPKEPEVWADKAEAHLRLKQLSLSMVACVQALTHDHYNETRKRVLPILDELCQAQKAEEMLQNKKCELRAEADKHFSEKNYQDTLICLGQLLDLASPSEAERINSEIANVLVLKAFVLRRQHQAEASYNCFTQALLFNPTHPIALRLGDQGILSDTTPVPPKKMKREI